jgi:hypothetical protein
MGAASGFGSGLEFVETCVFGSLNGFVELKPLAPLLAPGLVFEVAATLLYMPTCFGVRVRPESVAGELGEDRVSQSVSLSFAWEPGGCGKLKLSEAENGRTDMGVVASGGGAGMPGTSRY